MFRSLRARIALSSFAATAITLLAVGGYLISDVQSAAQNRIDQGLERRTALIAGQLNTPLLPTSADSSANSSGDESRESSSGESNEAENQLSAPPQDEGPEGGDPQATVVTVGNKVVLSSGNAPAEVVEASTPGLQTVGDDGNGWRVLVSRFSGGRIVAATSLAKATARANDLRDRALLIGAVGLVAAAAIGFLLASLATRSVRRLRLAADQVTGTEALDRRIPETKSPEELRALAASLNAMLSRIETSHEETAEARDAARRFAAEAGHELRTPLAALGTNLELLEHSERLEAAELVETRGRAQSEYARMVRLLDSLQALARGEASADLPLEATDLADIAGAAVHSVHAAHRGYQFEVQAPEDGVPYLGHPEGLRRICENLLENAYCHGRENGKAVLKVEALSDGIAQITCDDDGPGIPEGDRTRVVERFARGADAPSGGSGLGLALVAQQAELHAGSVTVGESPLGGAQIVVTLGHLRA
ncbi:MAG: HAMP domain-containing sensor histidine kinase [Actinomycetes bacterium]